MERTLQIIVKIYLKLIHQLYLHAEAIVMKNMLQLKNNEVNAGNLKMHIKKEQCPNLYKLLQAAMTLPVSCASCERSFAIMRRIKTWLRSTMLQERLSNMSLLHIKSEIVKNKISAQKVFDRFTEKKKIKTYLIITLLLFNVFVSRYLF